MLKMVSISTRIGQISHVTSEGSKYRITIECSEEKKAYWVEKPVDFHLRVGEWITFQGSSRVEFDKNWLVKSKLYYHSPRDGSNKEEWTFQEITSHDFVYTKTAPPVVDKLLQETRSLILMTLNDWGSKENAAKLLLSLQRSTNLIQELLTPKLQDLAEPVAIVDLDL